MRKPEPVPTATVCSLCGLAWDLHDEKPTPDGCIELLKAELARRPKWNVYTGGNQLLGYQSQSAS